MTSKSTILILRFFAFFFYLLLITSCNSDNIEQEVSITGPIFKKLNASESGISFNNEIVEDNTYNHILLDVVFNGGGVAVIDINNDGLQDIFFSGNMVNDRLYLNKGNLKFQDITKTSGIIQGDWSTGVTVADVNNDGLLDLYVGKFIKSDPEKRANHLYINNGDLSFTESAKKYGIADTGHCTAVNFFDYDKDGDMDLYVGNEPLVSRRAKKEIKRNKGDELKYSDRLFRNENNEKFIDVTKEAGILNYNYTLSATVSDLNNDGWLDIYVASDYEEPDYYYQNNQDGTFTNVIHKAMRHISNFTMGVDLADFNNDGWMDLYSADMAPADNYRSKANMSGMNPERFWSLANNGFHYQYMFNNLQLNNGTGTFSEIAQLSGTAQTDWSWATLFADFDNDGDKDLYVTNGQPKDTRNKDYINRRTEIIDSINNVHKKNSNSSGINSLLLTELAPYEKLANYMFVNQGDLTFDDEANNWGLLDKSWTQGAAYADFDNDGDIDIVTNNIDDPAFLYENRATQKNNNNFLKVKLQGNHGSNMLSHGAKVWIYINDEMQLLEVSTNRGYMSSNDPVLHFGLKDAKEVDRLVAIWPNGKGVELKNIKANQTLELFQKNGKTMTSPESLVKKKIFKDIASETQLGYVHKENKHDDFKSEVLIPHRMSQLGPTGATADVNGDGLDDIFLGGAAGQSAELYLQNKGNKFVKNNSQPWQKDKASEDLDALFFDADNDNDIDLYVVSGGNEFPEGSKLYQDRLYLNDGKGNFQKSTLPKISSSGGVASAGDFDNDGDLDLFIGGRQTPNKYGFAPRSYLLINKDGKFIDQTEAISPELKSPGMVSDAIWMDVDNDEDNDLVMVGEWMPISIFINENGKLSNQTDQMGLANSTGWWNRIETADIDNDGDQDLIAGNLGLNIKFKASEEKPFTAKIKDFDENGSNDIYLAYYGTDGNQYPVRGRQCSSEQMPFIKEKFKTYNEFALASFDEVLGDLAEDAVTHEAKMFESVYIENQGNGNFTINKLPSIAQTFPTFGILPKDWNKDGHLDLLLAGNYYEREVETTRSDAGTGLLLTGDGKGNFHPVSAHKTGLLAYFDVRELLTVNNDRNKPIVFIMNNNLGMQVYELE